MDKKSYDEKRYIEKREEILEQQGQYYKNNRIKILTKHEEWRKNNPEYKKQWLKDKPGYDKLYYHNHLEKVRAIGRKKTNKRDRNLGFNPLNEFNEGLVGHHINKNDIIYIPKKIHQNVAHCLETGKNMKRINSYAIAYLEGVA